MVSDTPRRSRLVPAGLLLITIAVANGIIFGTTAKGTLPLAILKDASRLAVLVGIILIVLGVFRNRANRTPSIPQQPPDNHDQSSDLPSTRGF
jgi:hypothetical protein